MKKINKKLNVLVLAIILSLFSLLYIIINGKTYTVKLDINSNINSIEELNIKIEQGNVRCIEKKIENGVLELKFEPVSKGKAGINIIGEDYYKYFNLYVHNFDIITFDNYFGDCNGSKIISISVTLLLIYIVYLLIKSYRKNLKENMYQYKNIAYLGLIIFLTFSIINQILTTFHYKGMISTIEKTIRMCAEFSIILLPIAFIISILVTLSNLVLVKKEGLNWKNLLGLILGILFCLATILPDVLNEILQASIFIDVHNEQGLGAYIQMFVETLIYVIVSYLECILIGTIIIARKAAKHIPEFNKDFILILGCQIKKDGTLTNLLKARVDRAIEFRDMQKEKTGKDLIFVPSGGQGSDEIISEAQSMKNYLIEKGINEENILIEDKSKNTFENIKFSNNIIKQKKQDAKIAFSTTNYHVFRAGAIASSQSISIEGIGAKTKSYFWINAFIREFIATLNSEKKKHIIILSIIMIAIIFMIGLVYLSNVI